MSWRCAYFLLRDYIPCKEIKSHKLPKNVEGILVEITMRRNKWLILGGYNPNKDNISYYLSHISKEIDKLLGNYENILMLDDFN